MKIISADSSAAILNDNFDPQLIVATAAVYVQPPYREASSFLSEPIFTNAANGHEVITHEIELCRDLAGKVTADVVHLDMSLGSIPIEELSPVQFSNMRISGRAKQHLLKILPKLRKVNTEITQKYRIQVLAIGKESIPVRIAELTSGANAVLYACEKVVKENQSTLLGLPSKCQPRFAHGRVNLHSLITAEHDVRGYAEDHRDLLKKVNISELLNPCARGFRALRITPK